MAIDKDPGPARERGSVHRGWSHLWYRDRADVWSDFASEWRLMAREAPSSNPYQQPEFVRGWAETMGTHRCAPSIGVFRHRAGHRVLLPWVVDRHEGRFVERRILEYAGRELAGYQAPLIAPSGDEPIDFDDLWEAVQRATEGECDQGLMRYLPANITPSWASHG